VTIIIHQSQPTQFKWSAAHALNVRGINVKDYPSNRSRDPAKNIQGSPCKVPLISYP